jgi:hypothetical protein
MGPPYENPINQGRFWRVSQNLKGWPDGPTSIPATCYVAGPLGRTNLHNRGCSKKFLLPPVSWEKILKQLGKIASREGFRKLHCRSFSVFVPVLYPNAGLDCQHGLCFLVAVAVGTMAQWCFSSIRIRAPPKISDLPA